MRHFFFFILPTLLFLSSVAVAADPTLRTADFSRDPSWEGVNNRTMRGSYPTVVQDFGFSADTNFAGKEKGEIGGVVHRSSTPAVYAMAIERTTLDRAFSASGTLAVPQSVNGAGALFGFFNHDFTPGQRPTNSVLFHVNGNGTIHVRAISANSHGTGMMINQAGKGKRDHIFTPGEAKHHWSIDYNPADKGRITVRFDDLAPIVFDLLEDVRKDGITLDRFGIVNAQKPGRSMTMYLDDIAVDGKTFDFATDPKWESRGSQAKFEDKFQAAEQDFGYSPEKNAIGGTVWHTAKPLAWYADRVGPLDLSRPLHASGKVTLQVGAPDSGVLLGWFNSTDAAAAKLKETKNFIGAHIEGPTRVGHYFLPRFNAADGTRRETNSAAVLPPDGKPHAFSIDYDPQKSQLTTTLDGKTATTTLQPSGRQNGATFDRFGLLGLRRGGQFVTIWVDDLTYTATALAAEAPVKTPS
jgi:hypothetical protein